VAGAVVGVAVVGGSVAGGSAEVDAGRATRVDVDTDTPVAEPEDVLSEQPVATNNVASKATDPTDGTGRA